MRIETWIDAPKIRQTANHQASADEKNDGEGHFESDENALRTMTRATAASTFFEGGLNGGAGRFKGRDQAKENSRQKRGDQGEEKDARIDMNFIGAWQSIGEKSKGGLRAPSREKDAERTSGKGEQNTFRKKLADDAIGIRAERGTNGELPAARGGASEQKIGHIGASDQKNETDRSEEHEEKGTNAADDIFLQRKKRDAGTLVGVGIHFGETRSESEHVCLRLSESDAGPEAADGVHAHGGATIAEEGIVPLTDGDVDLSVAGKIAVFEVEGGGKHADDGAEAAIEIDGLAEDVWRSGELLLPERFTDHGDGSGAELVFLFEEKTAEDRLDTERGEKRGGDHIGGEALRFTDAGEIETVSAKSG